MFHESNITSVASFLFFCDDVMMFDKFVDFQRNHLGGNFIYDWGQWSFLVVSYSCSKELLNFCCSGIISVILFARDLYQTKWILSTSGDLQLFNSVVIFLFRFTSPCESSLFSKMFHPICSAVIQYALLLLLFIWFT